MEGNLAVKKNTKIVLNNQDDLIITGVSKVISSTENQILVVLEGKTLQIDGSKLTTPLQHYMKRKNQSGFLDLIFTIVIFTTTKILFFQSYYGIDWICFRTILCLSWLYF